MKINYVSLCSGYGAECIALKRLKRDFLDFDFDCLAWSEIEPSAIKAHDAIHEEYRGRNLGDLTKVNWTEWYESIGKPHIDLLFASTPCQSVSLAQVAQIQWHGLVKRMPFFSNNMRYNDIVHRYAAYLSGSIFSGNGGTRINKDAEKDLEKYILNFENAFVDWMRKKEQEEQS